MAEDLKTIDHNDSSSEWPPTIEPPGYEFGPPRLLRLLVEVLPNLNSSSTTDEDQHKYYLAHHSSYHLVVIVT